MHRQKKSDGKWRDTLNNNDINLINMYSIKPLEKEDIFCFKVVLCDNEVDRDFEKFSLDALYKLEKLFVGKTGIADHNPKTDGQMARIYKTATVKGDHKTKSGEMYTALVAHAYMVRCEKNSDIIREIEAGIKKEVSVGCCVEKTICSICGNDVRENRCSHTKGEFYDGDMCYHILDNPTDAYEWSFVAVPAQVSAGVTKTLNIKENFMGVTKKIGIGEISLSKSESIELKSYIEKLESRAEFADKYKKELVDEVVKFGYLAYPEISSDVIVSISKKLDIDELKMLKSTFMKNTPLASPQLVATNPECMDNKEFYI